MKISFQKITGLFLLFLFIIPGIWAQEIELDSTQIKMIKALGPEKVQLLVENMMKSSSPENQAKFKQAIDMLKQEKPSVETVKLKDKTVKFVPIAHAGKKVFYDNLTAIIKEHQKTGYVVFYEQMKRVTTTTEVDTLRLKFRKIVPVEPTRKLYSILTLVYPDVIAQPEYDLLGITGKDVNADISVADYVAQYEKIYGPIVLEQCDFDAKIGTPAKCKPLKNNLDAITIDYRNQNLADMVKKSDHKKILVIYGALHIPGMIELLKE